MGTNTPKLFEARTGQHDLNKIVPANSSKGKRITNTLLLYFPHSSCSTFSASTAHLPYRHGGTNSTWNNHCDSFGLGKKIKTIVFN